MGVNDIFVELVQDDGSIFKKKFDYFDRAGVTEKPIATYEVYSVQVLHDLLRTFDHLMKLAVHLRAEFFDWSESPTSIKKRFFVNAKKEIQERIEIVTGERWDFPDQNGKEGNTTNGNTARRILYSYRYLVIEMIPTQSRNIMN